MARHAKQTGKSEVIARLRRHEDWNNKRFSLPVVDDSDDEKPDCRCAEPSDSDEGVCMSCGLCINYRSMK